MPLSNLLKSAAGTCPFCRQKAGILSREHPECRRAHRAGWNEMVQLAADAAGSHEFNPNSLQVALTEIARRSFGDASTVARALEEGWKQRISHARVDGIIFQVEEARLREFSDKPAMNRARADRKATVQLEKASTNRLTLDAQLVAVAMDGAATQLNNLDDAPRANRLRSWSKPGWPRRIGTAGKGIQSLCMQGRPCERFVE